MLNRTFCETWNLQLHHSRLLTLNTYYSQVLLSRTLCVINYRYSTIVNTITLIINGNDDFILTSRSTVDDLIGKCPNPKKNILKPDY